MIQVLSLAITFCGLVLLLHMKQTHEIKMMHEKSKLDRMNYEIKGMDELLKKTQELKKDWEESDRQIKTIAMKINLKV